MPSISIKYGVSEKVSERKWVNIEATVTQDAPESKLLTPEIAKLELDAMREKIKPAVDEAIAKEK